MKHRGLPTEAWITGIALNGHSDLRPPSSMCIQPPRETWERGLISVALGEEIGACAEFIELHQVLSGNITFVVEIEGCAWGASVPSMVLQPLLENAIQHGADIDGSVEIKIGASTQGGDLVVSVVNSVNRRSAGGLGIGLDNLRKRLVLAHGAEASLTTRREENRFVVSIRLPLMEHNQP